MKGIKLFPCFIIPRARVILRDRNDLGFDLLYLLIALM